MSRHRNVIRIGFYTICLFTSLNSLPSLDGMAIASSLEPQPKLSALEDSSQTSDSSFSLNNEYLITFSPQEHLSQWQQTLESYEEVGDHVGAIQAYLALGQISWSADHYEAGIAFYEQGMSVLQHLRTNQTRVVPNSEDAIQPQEADSGEPISIATAQAIEDQSAQLAALHHLTQTYLSLEDYQSAYFAYQSLLDSAYKFQTSDAEENTSVSENPAASEASSEQTQSSGLAVSQSVQAFESIYRESISESTILVQVERLRGTTQFIDKTEDFQSQGSVLSQESQQHIGEKKSVTPKNIDDLLGPLKQNLTSVGTPGTNCETLNGDAQRSCYQAALESAAQAWTAAESSSDRYQQANALLSIAEAYLGLGKSDEARARLKLVPEILTALNHSNRHIDRANLWMRLGDGYVTLEQYPDAVQFYLSALENFQAEGNHPENELKALSKLEDTYELIGDIARQVDVLNKLASQFFLLERYDDAVSAYETIPRLYQSQQDPLAQASTLLDLGDICFSLNRNPCAINAFRSASQLFISQGVLVDSITARLKLGNVLLRTQEHMEALELSRQILEDIKSLRRLPDEERPEDAELLELEQFARSNIGNAYLGLEQFDEAFESLRLTSEAASIVAAEGRLGRWPQTIRLVGGAATLLNFLLPGSTPIISTIASIFNGLDDAISFHRTFYGGAASLLSDVSSRVVRDQFNEAIEELERVLEIAKTRDDRVQEIDTRINLGKAYLTLEEYAKAGEFFGQVLNLLREEGNIDETVFDSEQRYLREADALVGLAKSQYLRATYEEAERSITGALDILRNQNLENPEMEADAVIILSKVHLNRGEYQDAKRETELALSLLEQLANVQQQQADTLLVLSSAELNLRNYQEALDKAGEALELFQSVNHPVGQANSWLLLGNAHLYLGQYGDALDFTRQALLLFRNTGNRSGEASALNVLGNILHAQRQYRQAIAYHQLSSAVQNTIRETEPREGRLLEWIRIGQIATNILGSIPLVGEVLIDVFEPVAASIDSIIGGNTLVLIRSILNISEGVSANLGVSNSFFSQGDYDEALRSYQGTLKIARGQDDRAGGADSLLGISNTYLVFDRHLDRAQENTVDALAIYQDIGDRAGEAYALITLSQVYLKLAENESDSVIREEYSQQAIDYNQQALVIFQQEGVQDNGGLALAFSTAGDIQASQGQNLAAIAFYKESVRLTEDIRRNNQTLPEELQRSYLGTVADTYRKLADLLLAEGRIIEAQQVLELLKIEELRGYELSQRSQSRDIEISPLDTEGALITDYGSLAQFRREVNNCKSRNCSDEELNRLLELLDSLQAEFNSTVQMLNDEVRRRRCNAGNFLNPTTLPNVESVQSNAEDLCQDGNIIFDPNHFSETAREIINAQPGTLLVYPFVLEDRLWLLWAGEGRVIGRKELPISRAELSRLVFEFRNLIRERAPIEQVQEKGAALYDLLIEPIEAELEEEGVEIKHLVFSLDQVTRYIPMAALFDRVRGTYLIENYTVATVLSAELTDYSTRLPVSPQDSPILAAGVVSTPNQDFQALPSVEDEITQIVAQNDFENSDGGIYPGIELLNDQVTYESLRNALERGNGFGFLHLATHGAFIPNRRGESYLLMGNGERLTTPGIQNLSNYVDRVHLVVLSACETGVGGADDDGIEIAGINSYFLRGGARAVLGTLWNVNDCSTSVFMQNFYRTLARNDISKARALQEAQLELMRSDPSVTDDCRARFFVVSPLLDEVPLNPSQPIGYAHPYYWAPFTLVGNGL